MKALALERDRDDWLQAPFLDRLAIVREGLARLQAKIAEQCPGEHRFTQHQDLRPPWCEACGYCDNGLHRREVRHAKV